MREDREGQRAREGQGLMDEEEQDNRNRREREKDYKRKTGEGKRTKDGGVGGNVVIKGLEDAHVLLVVVIIIDIGWGLLP